MCELTVWLKKKSVGKKIKIGFYVEDKNQMEIQLDWFLHFNGASN